MIQKEMEFLSTHYRGHALNDLLQEIFNCFELLEKEVLSNKSQFETLYGKGDSDGYV